MHFCDYLKTEPYVAVNTGDGQVDSALQELEYAPVPPKHRSENPCRKRTSETV